MNSMSLPATSVGAATHLLSSAAMMLKPHASIPKQVPGMSAGRVQVADVALAGVAVPSKGQDAPPDKPKARPRGRPKKFHEWDPVACEYKFVGTPEDLNPPPVEKVKKKKIHDPNKPKRGMSPFLYFGKEARPVIMKEHPEWTFVQVQKELSSRWQKMTDEEQQPYKDISIAKMTQYKENMKSYTAPTQEELANRLEQDKLEKQKKRVESKVSKRAMQQVSSQSSTPSRKKPRPPRQTPLRSVKSAKVTDSGFDSYMQQRDRELRFRFPQASAEKLLEYAHTEWSGLTPQVQAQYTPKSTRRKRRNDTSSSRRNKGAKRVAGNMQNMPVSTHPPLRDEELAASGLSQLSVQQELYEAQLLMAQAQSQEDEARDPQPTPIHTAVPATPNEYIRMGLQMNPNFTQIQNFRFSPVPHSQGRYNSPGIGPNQFASPMSVSRPSHPDLYGYQMQMMAMMAQAQATSPAHAVSPESLQRQFLFSPEAPATRPSKSPPAMTAEDHQRIESNIQMQQQLKDLQMMMMHHAGGATESSPSAGLKEPPGSAKPPLPGRQRSQKTLTGKNGRQSK